MSSFRSNQEQRFSLCILTFLVSTPPIRPSSLHIELFPNEGRDGVELT